jgi:hypothetical protein
MVRMSLCLAKPGSVKRRKALDLGLGCDAGWTVEAGRPGFNENLVTSFRELTHDARHYRNANC